ncbi:methyltransferase domain-containing protein [Candidatus Peregrinibacteria bacterium]|nr:methyltransferase domain-containing protein [Candidatus Peregrinibacteria bacterium]
MSFLGKAKQKLKYILPPGIKKVLKYVFYSIQDAVAFITGKRNKEYPPKRLNFVGSSEFKKIGNEFLQYFKQYGHITPRDVVLDIGSGIGRMAIPLTHYLDADTGAYYGFDIDKRGIAWCVHNITSRYPHFHFQYVDIYNKYYNKKGGIQADEFTFPYKDKQFDFIFATSVFTHMLPAQIKRYLQEISRVLKPEGKVLLTFFSIDENAQKNMKEGHSYCQFSYSYGSDKTCFYSHKDMPEAETGYTEDWIIKQLKKEGIDDQLKMYHGSWSGRDDAHSYQDIICARKRTH